MAEARTTRCGGEAAQTVADTLSAELSELLDAVRSRDEAALGRLYDLTVDRVYGLALRVLEVAADAEEVVVDVYRQVWQGAATYDARRGGALAWIMVIAHSRALDHLRRRRARPDGDQGGIDCPVVADGAPAVLDLLDAIETGTRVHAALARIRPEQRQLIGLAFLRGMSHPEIAERTGIPLGTVKSHIRRGLAALRELLDGDRDA